MFGSDIDGRQMRGKGTGSSISELVLEFVYYKSSPSLTNTTADEPGIRRAAAQYGVSSRIIDLCTFDLTKNPWRCGGLFDAILTDPPCESQSLLLSSI